jgi:hypothetical protein
VALRQVFSEYFGFPCQFSFHQLLHTHHLPSGAGTAGQIVADVPSGLSLAPPQDTKKRKKNLLALGPQLSALWDALRTLFPFLPVFHLEMHVVPPLVVPEVEKQETLSHFLPTRASHFRITAFETAIISIPCKYDLLVKPITQTTNHVSIRINKQVILIYPGSWQTHISYVTSHKCPLRNQSHC